MATIIGTQQSDNLAGTANDDIFIGLSGHDISTGGDGGDRFVYQRLSNLSGWTGSVLPWHETITDFGEHGNVIEGEGQDLIDFSALSDFLFIGDDEFSATGRNEYRFQRFGEFGMLLLFDKGGDGTADRYLVLDKFRSEGLLDQPSEHPIFTNLLDPADFNFRYEVGTAANETIVGTDDGGAGGFDGDDRLYGFAGDDRMHGKGGDDEMFGGAGNDRLEGGAGFDTLIGGPGNDVYFVQTSEFEPVIELPGEGIDLVTSSAFFNPLPENVENLTLAGGEAYQGTGNSLANIITGSSANNRLGGHAGNDAISGGAGGNSIRAGTGHDWIRGGTGADYLIGNSGADKFVYYSVAEAGMAGDGTGDFIRDFESINAGATEPDRIDLHRIDANTATAADDAFRLIGGEFTGTAGELHAVFGFVEVVDPDPFFPDPSFQANIWLVEGDVDGDAAADFQIGVIQPQFSGWSAGRFLPVAGARSVMAGLSSTNDGARRIEARE